MSRSETISIRCDRCGHTEEIQGEHGRGSNRWGVLSASHSSASVYVATAEKPADICEDCAGKFLEWWQEKPLSERLPEASVPVSFHMKHKTTGLT